MSSSQPWERGECTTSVPLRENCSAQRLQGKKKHVRFGTEGRPVWLERVQSTLELQNEMRLNRSFELRKRIGGQCHGCHCYLTKRALTRRLTALNVSLKYNQSLFFINIKSNFSDQQVILLQMVIQGPRLLPFCGFLMINKDLWKVATLFNPERKERKYHTSQLLWHRP